MEVEKILEMDDNSGFVLSAFLIEGIPEVLTEEKTIKNILVYSKRKLYGGIENLDFEELCESSKDHIPIYSL